MVDNQLHFLAGRGVPHSAALWYAGPNRASNAIDYAKSYSRSHDAVIRVYDAAGNVIETCEREGDLKAW